MRPRPRPALEVQQAFKRAYGYQATFTALAPVSVELLGSHAEANEGLALMLAINQYVQIAAAPRQDGRVELVFPAQAGRELFWLSDIPDNAATPWADPIKSVMRELRRRGVTFSGFSAAIHSGVAAGIGGHEFAAMQAATALIIRKLYPYRLSETGCLSRPPQRDRYGQLPALAKVDRLLIARLCHQAASRLPGQSSAWLDLVSSLCGKSFHVLAVDCPHRTVEPLPMIGEVVVVVCPSGVTPTALDKELEKRHQLSTEAAGSLRAKNLRSVDPRYLSTHRMRLTEQEYACAYHIVGETQRVIFAESALRDGDFLQFGQYLNQSHESARDFFRSSCLELDWLVDWARDQAGCIGSRMSGAGFGGATISLVTINHYEEFIQKMSKAYERQTGRRVKPLVCQVVDGAE